VRERIKELLDEYGEVQLYLESGAEFEIHGEVVFDQSEIEFEDGNGEVFYIDVQNVEYVSVHRSHRSRAA